MADIVQDLLDLKKLVESNRPKVPRSFFYPESLVKEAAEVFKDTDWIINGHEGSQYRHGVQLKKLSTSISSPVALLNAKIEAMDLPDYLKTRPKGVHVYLRGISGPYRIYGGARGGGKSFLLHYSEEDTPELMQQADIHVMRILDEFEFTEEDVLSAIEHIRHLKPSEKKVYLYGEWGGQKKEDAP